MEEGQQLESSRFRSHDPNNTQQQKHCSQRVVKLSSDYFNETPQQFCKVVAYARKKQRQNKLAETDKMFGFPKNKKDLSKEELSAYAPKNEEHINQLRTIIQELFTKSGGKFSPSGRSSEEVAAFSKWLAENGGFSGLLDGNESWRKSEGLCYIAYLRQYCIKNYRAADALFEVNLDVIAEAVTVLYKYQYYYNIKDVRVARMRRLIHQYNYESFKPSIFVLRSEGWWDTEVSLDQYKSLMERCDGLLRDYYQKSGKNWTEKVLNANVATAQELKIYLDKLRKSRKTRMENSLMRKNDTVELDSIILSDNDAAEQENNDSNRADVLGGKSLQSSSDDEYNDDDDESTSSDSEEDDDDEQTKIKKRFEKLKNAKKQLNSTDSPKLRSGASKTKSTTNSTPSSSSSSKINAMEENSKSPPKRKSKSEIAENSGKKQKTNDSTESREKSQNEVRPAEIEEDEVIFKSADDDSSAPQDCILATASEKSVPAQQQKQPPKQTKVSDVPPNVSALTRKVLPAAQKELKNTCNKTVTIVNNNKKKISDAKSDGIQKDASSEPPLLSCPSRYGKYIQPKPPAKDIDKDPKDSSPKILNVSAVSGEAENKVPQQPPSIDKNKKEDETPKSQKSTAPIMDVIDLTMEDDHFDPSQYPEDETIGPVRIKTEKDASELESIKNYKSVLMATLDSQNSFRGTFERQWLEKQFCDVELVAPCGRSISAHKFILSAGSPVLSAEIKKKLEDKEEMILEIKEVTYEVLEDTLRFLYTGKLNKLDLNSVGALLAAASKFHIDHLTATCKQFLIESLNSVNALIIVDICKTHGIEDVRSLAKEFILHQL